HSAAYAFVSYQTAYLKAHYFVEYMAALLSSVKGDQDKTQMYIAECQKHGVKVLAPDINKSFSDFAPDEDNIRFGLGAIKNVGEAVIENICKEREANGEYKSLYDFCTRVDLKSLNKRTMESLIRAGAFANIEKSRKQLMYNLDSIIAQAQRENESKALGQASLFAALGADSGFGGGSYKMQGDESEFSDKEIQQFEKDYLGFYVTSHPLSSIRNSLPFLTTHNIAELSEMPADKPVTICGLLTQVRQVPFKKDPTKFLKAGLIEDLTGKIEFVVFYKTLLEVNSFVENEQKVIFSGKVQRKEEDQISIVVDSVRPVENANVVTLALKKDITFETLMSMKDLLVTFKGSDPLMFKLDNMDGEKILTSSGFWVNATNDFVNAMKANFGEYIEVGIKSLDS
ncbi:DNA polymerase III subunit alpha, partial [bacterium]|nr:DNA polymerase III subunit alpha [bacterium]